MNFITCWSFLRLFVPFVCFSVSNNLVGEFID